MDLTDNNIQDSKVYDQRMWSSTDTCEEEEEVD